MFLRYRMLKIGFKTIRVFVNKLIFIVFSEK